MWIRKLKIEEGNCPLLPERCPGRRINADAVNRVQESIAPAGMSSDNLQNRIVAAVQASTVRAGDVLMG